MDKLPSAELVEMLSQMAAATEPERIRDLAATWRPELHRIVPAVREGVGALMDLAGELDIGFSLSRGWRCGLSSRLCCVEACDNYADPERHVTFIAGTALGALAGAIIAMEQLRAETAR